MDMHIDIVYLNTMWVRLDSACTQTFCDKVPIPTVKS